jgi:hypothetical protein
MVGERRGCASSQEPRKCAILAHHPLSASIVNQQSLPQGNCSVKAGRARRIREETTMSLKWIAQRLHMGSWTYATCSMNNPQRSRKRRQCCRCVNSED